MKRAGLDYWRSVCVRFHDDWDAFAAYYASRGSPGRLVGFNGKMSADGSAPLRHDAPGSVSPGDWLLFGSETDGLNKTQLKTCAVEGPHGGGVRRIPIDAKHVRSLNLGLPPGGGGEAGATGGAFGAFGNGGNDRGDTGGAGGGGDNTGNGSHLHSLRIVKEHEPGDALNVRRKLAGNVPSTAAA